MDIFKQIINPSGSVRPVEPVKDQMLVVLGSSGDGRIIAYQGGLRCGNRDSVNGVEFCAIEWETMHEGSSLNDHVGLSEDFIDLQSGIYLWTGELYYCSGCNFESAFCDCGVEWRPGEVRLATVQDLKAFGLRLGETDAGNNDQT